MATTASGTTTAVHPVLTAMAQARSVALAAARGHTACSHAAHVRGWSLDDSTGELVSLALEIESATSEQVYAIGYLAATDDAVCECHAAQHSAPCWHRGLAILVGRATARLYTPASRAETARERYLAWINEPASAAL